MKHPEFKERRESNRDELWETKGLGALGAYDADERVEALDRMGIKAQLMFANNTLYDLRATTAGARDACVRYNDYALDFTRRTKGRCRAVCHINTSDVDFAIAEANRVIKRGAKAVDLPCTQPPGGVSPSHELWDPLWAAARGGRRPGFHPPGKPGAARERPARRHHVPAPRLAELRDADEQAGLPRRRRGGDQPLLHAGRALAPSFICRRW